MKLNIAPKLFLGFLIVILFNTTFVVIASKLTDLNIITEIVRRQNEIRNRLLQISSSHGNRVRSRVIYSELGTEGSAKNFIEASMSGAAQIDSVLDQVNAIRGLDRVVAESDESPMNMRLMQVVRSRIHENDRKYLSAFRELVRLKTAPTDSLTARRINAAGSIMDSTDRAFRSGLDVTDSLIKLMSAARIRETQRRIDNTRSLTLIIVAGISLFSIIFALFFSRVMTTSLRRLRESARVIAKGDFSFDPGGYPSDEIGDLAKAFFDMANDLKQTQEELIKSKRLAAIGEIVASVNHEINNPLMIISGNAQFLEMSMDEFPDEMKDRVKAILEETERISLVTRKLREIRNPIVEDYTASGEQMINLDKSSI